MHITIASKHITLNDAMKGKIERQFEHLANFMKNDDARLEIEVIKVTGEHHLKGKVFDVEAKLHMTPGLIKAGAAGEGVLEACNHVKKELERQLLKAKERSQASSRDTRKAVRAIRGKM